MRKWLSLLVFGVVGICIDVKAEQKAHEHGVSLLMLVSEGTRINIQMESPAMNIVGFEHEPKTKAQQKTLEQALQKLNKPESLIAFNAGQCSFTSVDLDNPFVAQPEHDHDEHKHEEDKHEHEHDHDEHKHAEDKHEHDHDHDHSDAEHREFVVAYQVQCKKIDDLKAINFTLLNEFKGIEKLEVQYILSGKQGAVTLNSSNSRLSIDE